MRTIALVLLLLVVSCNQIESPLIFEYVNTKLEQDAQIELNYPKAKEGNTIGEQINNAIEVAIAEELSFSDEIKESSIESAVANFSKEYESFRKDFPESSQRWNASVEGEVLYESPEIISVLISTYIDTGGAHGNSRIIFLNFDPENGALIPLEDLIEDEDGFTDEAKVHFQNSLKNKKHDLKIIESFYDKDFQLPESIGFTDNGVIILYNTYEIAPYSFGITEFEIPWNDISRFISRR